MITVNTVALHGLTGHMISLVATAAPGEERITFTGDGDPTTLLLRVLAALDGAGERSRHRQVEVRLDPITAGWPDAAAVAVAMLAAADDVPPQRLAGTAVLGEVGLDGGLRPVRGTVPAVQAARAHGIRRIIVPAAAAREASLVDGVDVLAGRDLAEVAAWLRGDDDALRRPRPVVGPVADDLRPLARMLSDEALDIVEIAAAGGHHLLLDIADSAGSRLAADWLHRLLPDLTPAQQFDVAAVHSLTGPHVAGVRMSRTPPMVNAHPSRSLASLIGGAAPGTASEAHHGLLVTRALDQFSTTERDALRLMMRQREVQVVRNGRTTRYPAAFQLFATHAPRSGVHASRLSPALIDAFDITYSLSTFLSAPDRDRGCWTRVLSTRRARVAMARLRSAARWTSVTGPTCRDNAATNAAVPVGVLRAIPLPAETTDPMQYAQEVGALSARGADAVLRLAWTLADLAGAKVPTHRHVRRALSLRSGTSVRQDASPCGVSS
ncbi:MAG: magnesium chelatase family protein [Pseudonocardiales bacterium]|jgi:magnesium chelatase family protein|nr:magnesium chelatase family protein [Pseudonocardiales bacterium]